MQLYQAVLMVAQFAQCIAAGHHPRMLMMLIGVWFDKVYLPSIKRTLRSWRDHEIRFNRYVRPYIGACSWSQITEARLLQLVDQLRMMSCCAIEERFLSIASVNRIIALLKAMVRHALNSGLIDSNPARVLKLQRERNERARILRPSEREAFFAALASQPMLFQLLIYLLILTGMRLNEALTAKWSYVDSENRQIRLPDTKSGRPRVIPLSEPALEVCRKLWAMKQSEYLFYGKHGGHMCRPGRRYKALIEAAGTEGLWIHDLRRTFATEAAQLFPIQDVSRLLGHSNTAVTERYLVTRDERLHSAVACVGQQFAHLMPQAMASQETLPLNPPHSHNPD